MKVIHFPGHIKPYHPGVYRTRSANSPRFGYQKWNGRFWSLFHDDPDRAANCSGRAAEFFQNDDWWGLAENPKGEKA